MVTLPCIAFLLSYRSIYLFVHPLQFWRNTALEWCSEHKQFYAHAIHRDTVLCTSITKEQFSLFTQDYFFHPKNSVFQRLLWFFNVTVSSALIFSHDKRLKRDSYHQIIGFTLTSLSLSVWQRQRLFFLVCFCCIITPQWSQILLLTVMCAGGPADQRSCSQK